MFDPGPYFLTLDLTKTRLLLNLGLERFVIQTIGCTKLRTMIHVFPEIINCYPRNRSMISTLKTCFWLHNNHWKFSICNSAYTNSAWLLCTDKRVQRNFKRYLIYKYLLIYCKNLNPSRKIFFCWKSHIRACT